MPFGRSSKADVPSFGDGVILTELQRSSRCGGRAFCCGADVGPLNTAQLVFSRDRYFRRWAQQRERVRRFAAFGLQMCSSFHLYGPTRRAVQPLAVLDATSAFSTRAKIDVLQRQVANTLSCRGTDVVQHGRSGHRDVGSPTPPQKRPDGMMSTSATGISSGRIML